jgi:hypothetical protein
MLLKLVEKRSLLTDYVMKLNVIDHLLGSRLLLIQHELLSRLL